MTCRTKDDPSTDRNEINAVFRKQEDAEKMAKHFMESEGIDNKRYVDYQVIDFFVL